MLIVTGASGELGHRIVRKLLAFVPADRVGVSVRDPAKVSDLAGRGVRVRQGDFEDPAGLRRAWEGGQRLLLVSSNAAATGGDTVKLHAQAIAAARDVGIERILYTSQFSASKTSLFPPGRIHAETEELLAASGLAWTAMRHGFYAASATKMNARGFETGVIAAPEDGKVAWTTHDDLAMADAILLAGKIVIDGPTPPLTGSEALDLADLADMASDVLDRPIRRTLISETELEAGARGAGAPDGAVAVMLGYYRAARAGEFMTTDPSLAEILGHGPQSMRDFLRAELT